MKRDFFIILIVAFMAVAGFLYASANDLTPAAWGDGLMSVVVVLFVGFTYAAYMLLSEAVQSTESKRRMQKLGSPKASRAFEEKEKSKRREKELMAARQGVVEKLGERIQKFIKTPEDKANKLRYRLITAGYEGRTSVAVYLILRTFGLPVFGMIGFAGIQYYESVINEGEPLMPMIKWASLGLIAYLGYFLPDFILDRKCKGRMEYLKPQLADSLELIVVYTESGIAFDNALGRVLDQIKTRMPVAWRELSLFRQDLRLLTREEAYNNFKERANVDIVRSMCSILNQADSAGTSVSEALQRLAVSIRAERFREAEKKAQLIPMKQQPSTMMAILCLMAILIIPVGIMILDAFAGVQG